MRCGWGMCSDERCALCLCYTSPPAAPPRLCQLSSPRPDTSETTGRVLYPAPAAPPAAARAARRAPPRSRGNGRGRAERRGGGASAAGACDRKQQDRGAAGLERLSAGQGGGAGGERGAAQEHRVLAAQQRGGAEARPCAEAGRAPAADGRDLRDAAPKGDARGLGGGEARVAHRAGCAAGGPRPGARSDGEPARRAAAQPRSPYGRAARRQRRPVKARGGGGGTGRGDRVAEAAAG